MTVHKIIETEETAFRWETRKRQILCLGVAGITLALNLLLTVLRTENNHSILLISNIAADVLCGWFILWFWDTKISPRIRIEALCRGRRLSFRCVVTRVEEGTLRVQGLDCRKLTVTGEEQRILFLPVHMPAPAAGTDCVFTVTGNIILEEAYEQTIC